MSASETSPKHVIFVPGFMCDERIFTPQTHLLTQLRTPYSVEPMLNGSTIRHIAETILDNAPSSFALAGLSMGGIVALEVIRIAPQRISHLALLNTTPYEDRSMSQRKDHMRRVKKGELTKILRDELKPRYLSPSTSLDALLPLITDMGEAIGADAFVRQSIALMIRKSAVQRLASITCKTAIITGADDMICPPEIHQDMARRIPNNQLHIIPNCGHLSTLEAPETINQILLEHWGFNISNNIIDFPIHKTRMFEKIS